MLASLRRCSGRKAERRCDPTWSEFELHSASGVIDCSRGKQLAAKPASAPRTHRRATFFAPVQDNNAPVLCPANSHHTGVVRQRTVLRRVGAKLMQAKAQIRHISAGYRWPASALD